jgi:hypothetical protein
MSQPTYPQPTYPQTQPPPKKKGGVLKWILIVVGIFVALIVLMVACVAAIGGDNTAAPPPEGGATTASEPDTEGSQPPAEKTYQIGDKATDDDYQSPSPRSSAECPGSATASPMRRRKASSAW